MSRWHSTGRMARLYSGILLGNSISVNRRAPSAANRDREHLCPAQMRCLPLRMAPGIVPVCLYSHHGHRFSRMTHDRGAMKPSIWNALCAGACPRAARIAGLSVRQMIASRPRPTDRTKAPLPEIPLCRLQECQCHRSAGLHLKGSDLIAQ